MAASQKTSSGIGEETRLARILGLSERDDAAVLSVRFPRGTPRRGCAQASHHRRRCHHAAHTRTSPTRLHLLSQHCVRRCLSFSGTHFSLVFWFNYTPPPPTFAKWCIHRGRVTWCSTSIAYCLRLFFSFATREKKTFFYWSISKAGICKCRATRTREREKRRNTRVRGMYKKMRSSSLYNGVR